MEVVRGVTTVVRVNGEIDFSNVDRFKEILNKALSTHPVEVIIDLSLADYIDSAGIAVILSAHNLLRPVNGKLILVTSNPNIQHIFGQIHADMLPGICVFSDLMSAMEHLSAEGD